MESTPRDGDRAAAGLMPPPASRPPKRGREIVLEEEEWIAKMEGIIERDFFPELGKLQDKVAWLEAVRSGNPELIRQAQLRIAQHRQAQLPGETPFTGARGMNGFPGGSFTPEETGTGSGGGSHLHGVDIPPVSLDAFLAHHTSEDNASFQDILERTNKRRKERAAALLAPPNDPRQKVLTNGPSASRQQKSQTGTQARLQYNPVNLLMYDGSTRNTLALSKKERADLIPGPPATINHGATRLHRPAPPHQSPGSETPSTSIDTASTVGVSNGGNGEHAITSGGGGRGVGATGAGGGGAYDILATPSFDPGAADASPFITWGEIEATPVRIEADDVHLGALQGGATAGPAFKMKETSRREQRGHALASKAGASIRRRPGTAVAGSTPARAAALAALGRGHRAGAGAGGSTPLSHAAQRLVGRLKKASDGVGGSGDAALRASYRGTPARGGSGWDSVGSTPAGTPRR